MNGAEILDALKEYLDEWDVRPGAFSDAIATTEASLSIVFPEDYKALLATSNGLNGKRKDGGYVILHAVEELPVATRELRLPEALPGIVLIGNNGTGHALGLDSGAMPTEYVVFPFDCMETEVVERCGPSLVGMLKWLNDGRSRRGA